MRSPIAEDVPLQAYWKLLSRHWLSLVVIVTTFMLAGVGLQAAQGTPVEAHQFVFVKDIKNGDTATGGELASIDFSLDTEAQLIRSDSVIKAIQEAAGTPMTQEEAESRLRVTALPNTRILALHVTMTDQAKATSAVQEASKAYLKARYDLLASSRAAQLALIQTRYKDLSEIVSSINKTVPTDQSLRTNVTNSALSKYTTQLRYIQTTRNQLAHNTLNVGEQLGTTSSQANYDGWLIKGASGIVVGLGLWAFLVALFDGAFQRILPRSRRRPASKVSTPIIGHVAIADSTIGNILDRQDPTLSEAVSALRAFSPISAVLAPLQDADSWKIASALDGLRSYPDPGTSGRVALIAPLSARAEDIAAFERRAAAASLETVGVIIVGK